MRLVPIPLRPVPIAVALAVSLVLAAAVSWVPSDSALGAVPSTTTTSTIAEQAPATSPALSPTTTLPATTTTTSTTTTSTSTTTTTVAPPVTTAKASPTTTTTPPRQTTTTTVAAVQPHLDADFASGLFTYANSARSAAGVGPLTWSSSLAGYAQKWAKRLGDSGDLRHSNFGSLLGSGWSTVGENVAMGHLNATAMHKAWMASSGHKANIVNANFTHVGTAVWIDAAGVPWGVQVFGG